jgi:hypothetical protein
MTESGTLVDADDRGYWSSAPLDHWAPCCWMVVTDGNKQLATEAPTNAFLYIDKVNSRADKAQK